MRVLIGSDTVPSRSGGAGAREYRVIWQREGQAGKQRRIYQTEAGALNCARVQQTARDEMEWLNGCDDYGHVLGPDRRPKPLIFGPVIESRPVGAWSPSPPSGAEPTEERCNYCGLLDWTRERYGAVTHKHACPHRRDPRCQSHPEGCPFGAEPTEPTREET